jgi:hypothetical protein
MNETIEKLTELKTSFVILGGITRVATSNARDFSRLIPKKAKRLWGCGGKRIGGTSKRLRKTHQKK